MSDSVAEFAYHKGLAEDLGRRVDAVRRHHKPARHVLRLDDAYCIGCRQPWPCSTLRVLDGDNHPEVSP